jgi:hypothetical protein
MTPYTIETEQIEGDVPFITTIHLDKDNKAYGYGESPEESVQDAIYQLAFTLTLDDGDRYKGFKIRLLPEQYQQRMKDYLTKRLHQLQSRSVKVVCLIEEWRNND